MRLRVCTRSEQEARRPRESLLPPLPPPKGRKRLSPHGDDWLKRFLATSSVPVSPESITASKWFARGESRPAEVCDRGALREEPPSYRRPRYLSPWQAESLEASSRPPLHAAPPTLPPDDSAFGIWALQRTALRRIALRSNHPFSGGDSGWAGTFCFVTDAWFGRPSVRLRIGFCLAPSTRVNECLAD